jgi:hypothetical protein
MIFAGGGTGRCMSRNLHGQGGQLHKRDGAGSGQRILRIVRSQHGGIGPRPRRLHLAFGAVMSTNHIRELNDAFRKALRGGKTMMTSGVADLPDSVKVEAVVQIASFSDSRRTMIRTGTMTLEASRLSAESSIGKSTTTTRAASSAPKTQATRRRPRAS